MRRSETICFKHEEIVAVAGKIASKTDDQEISDFADEVILQAERAKDDGCRMEEVLKAKGKRIAELEAEVEDLKEQIKELTAENESLQASQDLPV